MTFRVWLESTKPKVFAASIAPVCIGTAAAAADGAVNWLLAPLVLVCAMLIQLVSNWVNDLYDYRRGADRQRVGPRRVLEDGLISYRQLRMAAWMAAAACVVLGIPIMMEGGWPIALTGFVCLAAAWAYTGGPFPMAYNGLGDVAAFLFFGVVAIAGTYYVHLGQVHPDVWLLALGPGFLVANILGVNNIRDINTDAQVGKRTIAVRIGSQAARQLYVLATAVALLLPSFLLLHRGPWVMLPWACTPLAVWECYLVSTRQGAELNRALVGTSVLYLMYAILWATALVLI